MGSNLKKTNVILGQLSTKPVPVPENDKTSSLKSSISDIKDNKQASKASIILHESVPFFSSPKLQALPIFRSKIGAPVSAKKNFAEYTQDKLDISETKIKNNSFDPSEIDHGISTKRPELLSIFAYTPIFIGDPKNEHLSDHGKLIEVQHQTAYLRRDIIGELTLNIQKSADKEDAKSFGDLVKTFNKKLNELDSLVKSYSSLIDKKNEIEKKLNIKTLPATHTEAIKIDGEGLQINPTIKEFVTTRMGYNESQFEKFSNTKIYIQILADLKNIIENYSFNLLGLKDSDRINDQSATKIDTTYTVNDHFTFTIDKIRSKSEPINCLDLKTFNNILSTLPTDASERIKILLTILSKEYRISSELGDPSNNKLLSNFDAPNTGSPFDNILGLPGKTIFDPPKGEKTLLNLAHIQADKSIKQAPGIDKEDFFVLPFEERFIDFESGDKTFIPGKYYFADTIFETNNDTFNIAPITSFEKQFATVFSNTKHILSTLLQFNEKNTLDTNEMFLALMNACYSSMNGISPDFSMETVMNFWHKFENYDLNQMIISALFRLSSQDDILKNYLFQYLLLSGLSTNTDDDGVIIWEALIDELKTLEKFKALSYDKNFTEQDLRKGADVVKPHLENLAKTIEDRVVWLITHNVNTNLKNNKSKTSLSAIKDAREIFKDLPYGSISNSLTITNSWTSNNSNFCKEYLRLVNTFTRAAAVKNNSAGFLLEDHSGRTRYNFVSTSTQLLMLFEIFINLNTLFSKLELTQEGNKIGVRLYSDEQKIIFNTISQYITNRNVKEATDQNQQYYSIISDITTRLRKEDEIIGESLSVMQSIRDSIVSAKEIAASFTRYTLAQGKSISSAAKPQSRGSELKEPTNIMTHLSNKGTNSEVSTIDAATTNNIELIFKLNGTSALNVLHNQTQLKNSAYILRVLKERALNLSSQNPLLIQNPNSGLHENIIIGDEVKNEVKDILFSYLSTSEFIDKNNADTKIKVFSVGVPNNFSKDLLDKLHAKSTDIVGISSLQNKQSDVVKIKVYKRNLHLDDLVFKPKEFVFDLSLYVSENDLVKAKPEKFELFKNILQKVSVSDFNNPLHPTAYVLGKTNNREQSFLTDAKYSFLTDKQKTEMFTNHVSSFLLQNYIYLLTGMTINEEHLLTRGEIAKISRTNFDDKFEKILKGYFTKVLKKKIPEEKSLIEIEHDPNVDQEVKEIIKTYRTGNILTNPDKLYHKCFGAKFFDRIFHLPVDIDSFEIDLEQTRKTASGRKLLTKTFLINNTYTSGDKTYLKKRTSSDLILEDYFVNIETI